MSKFKPFTPAIPIAPGEFISDKLEYLNMTQKELALRIGCSEKHISNILSGKAEIERALAQRLSGAVGIDADILLKLELAYRGFLARIPSSGELELLKVIPYNQLVKMGKLQKLTKADEKVFELRKFFGVSNLMNIQDTYCSAVACREQKTAKNKDKTYYLYSWMRIAEKLSEGKKAKKFNKGYLLSQLQMFRKFSADNNFNPLGELCGECGIILVFSDPILSSGMYALSFRKNNNYLLIISARNRDADQFWFSFFHELYHIIFNKIEYDDPEVESEANAFAANTLIPPDEYRDFTAKADFGPQAIKHFAQNLGIHPCIIVGRLKRDKYIDYTDTRYKVLVPKLKII
jgi:HTH-type transcriptional regulator/antitoxin HigA